MKRSTNFLRPTFLSLVLLIYWSLIVLNVKECRGTESTTRRPQRLSAFLRNLAPTTTSESPIDAEITTWRPKSIRSIVDYGTNKSFEVNSSSTSKIAQPRRSSVRVRLNARRGASLPGTGKILGVDKENKRKPEELIRTALINHTLEHGGEEDLDKLVFSALPQGSKLVLRTVRIIKTDENGDPADEAEEQQPTYWDVTLANATVADDDDDDESSEESNEEEEEHAAPLATEKRPQVAKLRTPLGMQVSGISPGRRRLAGGNVTALYIRKKPDLLSAGSHSSENYHSNNDYGAVGREKEHGKTHYHGNTHGKTHKQTYTVTDGKDVKPYEGTEKGLTDYAHGHGSDNKDQGERFKSSKRKNKGRKVTGFKRVYHKEEFQRTEHFYDDEEARKIAESFGLSEAKESNDEGTKGDKRKYHGVRTEYLDGKKLENEHGTRNGYDKGQRNTYKDTEKHAHHSNYGKSMSHGNAPPQHDHHDDGGYHNHENHHGRQRNHHQEQQQHADYHPNHNYHASYSNPQKKTISRLPTSITDKLGGIRAGVNRSPPYAAAAIISAPITTSFTLTEYAPVATEQAASTPNPILLPENNALTLPPEKFTYEFSNFSTAPQEFSQGSALEYDDGREQFERETRRPSGRRQKIRKEPREKKIFFSPKHREIKEDMNNGSHQLNEVKYNNAQFQPLHVHALPYHVILPTRSNSRPEISASTRDHTTPASNDEEDNFPFAPNFSTQQHHLNPQPQSAYGTPGILTYQSHDNGQNVRRYPKSWRWPRRRPKHPRPSNYPDPTHASLPTQDTPVYPVLNQARLAAIPVRHANAYHRLGNRLRYRPHRPHILNYVEMSTRKSDVEVADSTEDKNTTNSGVDDDAALHYLNHNHRYAKNHLTSTIQPLASVASPLVETSTKNTVSGGVRNTLLGNTPEGYSTIIKVLPAKMINMNGSSVATAPVTKRPVSYVDLISITTAFPNLLPQPQQFQPQRLQPFIPRAQWLNHNSNYGNNNYGPEHQHQFSHTTRLMPNIMRGIRNSILRPFGRLSPMMPAQPPLTMAAYPTIITGVNGLQPTQLQKLPMTRPRLRVNPYYPQMHAQYPVSYGLPMGQYHHGGILSLGSIDYLNTAIPPTSFLSSSSSTPASTTVDKKPKFYYTFNASASSINDNNLSGSSKDSTTETGSESRFTSPIKVASIPTLAIASTSATPLLESRSKLLKRKQPQAEPAPMISGLMDSVSGFFGKVGG